MKFLPLVIKNLLRNRRRTILTVFSIAVSLSLLGFLLTVYAAFYVRDRPDEQVLRLVTRHRVSLTQALPEFYGSRIRAIDGVEEVCIQNWFGGIYKDNRPENFFARFAVEPDKIFAVNPEFEVLPEQLQAFLKNRQAMAVSQQLAERHQFELGQRITIKGDIYPVDMEFIIHAIFDGAEGPVAFFHWEYLQESLPEGNRGAAGVFTILARSPEDVPKIAAAVDDMFRNSPQPTKTETEDAFQLAFVEQIGNIQLFLLTIGGAVVFTIILVSANTMAMSTRERVQEIGVFKTLGFTSSTVVTLIVAESLSIAALGGVLGVLLCFAGTQFLSEVMVGFFSNFVMPLWSVPICLAVAMLIGLFSSIVPAGVAANTRIADALRHAG